MTGLMRADRGCLGGVQVLRTMVAVVVLVRHTIMGAEQTFQKIIFMTVDEYRFL